MSINIGQFVVETDGRSAVNASDELFQGAGYYAVDVSIMTMDWTGCHDWCRQQYGADHYSWTGSTFWFETEQDALLFTLRWS